MANGPSAKKPKTAAAVAFCGVMSALSLLFLLLTAVPVTEISLAALAGLTAVPVVIEVGRRFGLLQYAAVAVLALLLVPTMEGKALYIAFFGYYPVFKSFIEQRRLPRAAEWVLKLLVFNAATVAAYLIMLRFFGLDPQSFTIGGVPLPWVFLLLGNGVFVLYDWCMTRLIDLYLARFHARVRRLFRF